MISSEWYRNVLLSFELFENWYVKSCTVIFDNESNIHNVSQNIVFRPLDYYARHIRINVTLQTAKRTRVINLQQFKIHEEDI